MNDIQNEYEYNENLLKSSLNSDRLTKNDVKVFIQAVKGFNSIGWILSKEFLRDRINTYNKNKKSTRICRLLKKSNARIEAKNRYIQEIKGQSMVYSKKQYHFIYL